MKLGGVQMESVFQSDQHSIPPSVLDLVSNCEPTVLIDVRGHIFKVFRHSVSKRPDTLLAQLLEGTTSDGQPVFVDASPERFHHILDWYMYDEMFVPDEVTAQALLRDCAFFLLPDLVVVNGVQRRVPFSKGMFSGGPPVSQLTADYLHDLSIQQIEWPSFDEFFRARVSEIQDLFTNLLAENVWCYSSGLGTPMQKVVHDTLNQGPGVFLDLYNFKDSLCTIHRLWFFVDMLRQQGFECSLDERSRYLRVLLASSRCDPAKLRVSARL